MEKLRFKNTNGENFPLPISGILADISISSSSSISQDSIEKDFGEFPIYGASGEIKKISKYEKESNYVAIVKDGAGVGRVIIANPFSSVIGTMNYIENKPNCNLLYLYYLLQTLDFTKYVVGSGIPHIYFKDYKHTKIKIPTLKEQEKIGGFLSSFDKLIQKQQEKIYLLKELKKGYLQEIFPEKGSNIPKIRFNGFTDAWEQCKFKDVFIKLQNNSLSRADLNDEFGYAMNVHYGDVLIKFNEILDFKTESVPYITEPTTIEKYKNSFLQNGDIIIADAAEDNTVGKCCEIAGLSQETVLSGLHTIPCRPSKNFASGFLGYYMNSSGYHDQLLPLIQGSKISSISINTLSNTSLVYPKSIEEQSLIANKFRALDKLITLHQRKLERIEEIKKGYIQRLL